MNPVKKLAKAILPIWLVNQLVGVSHSDSLTTANNVSPERHFHTNNLSDIDEASVEGGQSLDTCLLIFSAEGGDSVSLAVTKGKKRKRRKKALPFIKVKLEIRTFY